MMKNITNYIQQAIDMLWPGIDLKPWRVERPANGQSAYATNWALANAKTFGGRNALYEAKLLAGTLEREIAPRHIKQVTVAAPGFINIEMTDKYYRDMLTIIASGKCGFNNSMEEDSVLLEFVSANPTGPVSIVNLRAAVTGDVLTQLFKKCGANVVREYYVNDGRDSTQVQLFARSVLHYIIPAQFAFPEDGYKGEYPKKCAEVYGKYFDPMYFRPNDVDTIINMAIPYVVDQQMQDLLALGVVFNDVREESHLHMSGEVAQVQLELENAGLTFEQDGKIWFKSALFGDDQDRVIVREDGRPTYLLADIAYHLAKYERAANFGNPILINILGADHHGYVPRLKAAMKALRNVEAPEVVFTQMVHLFTTNEDGTREAVKGSKRNGDVIELNDDFVQVVGRDAARWSALSESPNNHSDIDVVKIAQKDMKNPVYYAQYTYARICSLLQKAADEYGIVIGDRYINLDGYPTAAEKKLTLLLLEWDEEVKRAAELRAPHRITEYVLKLCALFNTYYGDTVIAPFDSKVFQTYCVQIILKDAMDVLGISTPTEM